MILVYIRKMRGLSVRLAIARIRKDLTFSVTVMIAVSLAFLSLFALEGVANSRTISIVSYALNSLPAGTQTITASSSRILTSNKDFDRLTEFLKKNSAGIISGTFTPLVLMHQISDSHGVGFYLGSLNTIQEQVRLTSGTFPKSCNTARCEVIQIGDSRLKPQPRTLGVVIVGTGKLINQNLFAGTYSLDSGVPLLLSNGIGSLENLSKSSTLQGTNGWVANLDRRVISQDGVDSLIERIVAVENRSALLPSSLAFTWPQDALSEASEASATLRAKISTIGYSIVILSVIFLVLLYLRKRKDSQRFRAGLSRLGTPESVLVKEAVLELCSPVAIGAVLALALTPALAAMMGGFGIQTHLPQFFEHADSRFFLFLTLIFALPAVTFFGDAAWNRRIWRPFSAAFLCFLIFLRLSPESSFSDWKVPLIGAFLTIALAFALLPYVSRILRTRLRSAFILLREEQLMWKGVSAVLSFAIFLAVVSMSFNASVSATIATQKQNQVPLDILIKPGSSLATPLDLGGSVQYANILKGSSAYPILRSATSIRTKSSVSDSITLIGIPENALTLLDFKSTQRLTSGKDQSFDSIKGFKLKNSSKLTVTLQDIPSEVDLIAWFQTPFGAHMSATFEGNSEIRTLRLGRNVPFNSKLIAFQLQETSEYLSRRLHAQGEGDFQVPILAGVGGIINVNTERGPIPLKESGWDISRFRYSLNGDDLYLHPTWKASTISVVADPETAQLAENGILTLTGVGNSSYRVRVIAVQNNFPSAGDRFIIARFGDLQSALALQDLGAIDPIELWISTSDSTRYESFFKNSKFQQLAIENQRTVGNYLRENPSNTALQLGYRIALGYASVLALFYLLSALPLMYRQKRELISHLEALGDSPRELRRSLRLALLTSLAVGVIIGCLIGVGGSAIFISSILPIKEIFFMAFSILALGDIGTRIYLRKLFGEKNLVVTSAH